MPIDIKTPRSPGWWMQKLMTKLASRQKRLNTLAAYHDGNPPLPTGAEAAREAYQSFQREARTNFAELIVGSVRERCSVRSVRTALGVTNQGDEVAHRIWRDNDLDIEFSDVLENMLALGDSYMIIGLDPDEEEPKVLITGEDPRQVVTIHDPAHQSIVRAAAKIFHDADEDRDYVYLYVRADQLGDAYRHQNEAGELVDDGNAYVFVASRPRKARGAVISFAASAFDWVIDDDEEVGPLGGVTLNHPYVPVVRFRNRRGIGEFEPHLDVLNRINRTLLQRMVIAVYQAFKQRALQVDEENMPDEDEETGEEIDYSDVLTSDPGSWLKIPFNAKIWESGQADMQGILSSIKDDVQHLAAVTRTPLSVVSPDAVNQSAEGSALIKEGQIFKTEDKQKRAAASLVLVFAIAFRCLGDEVRAEKSRITIDWAPAERFSLQQKYDAASKGGSLVPTETLWADVLQMSPEKIEIARAQRLDDAMIASLSGPAPAPTPRSIAS